MKPTWAQGPEWDGWAVLLDESLWGMESDLECTVCRDGALNIFNQRSGHTVKFKCKSPEHARVAAESLLGAME